MRRCQRCGGYFRQEDHASAFENAGLAGAMIMDIKKCECGPTLLKVKTKLERVRRMCDGLPTELRRELEEELTMLDESIAEMSAAAEEEAKRAEGKS